MASRTSSLLSGRRAILIDIACAAFWAFVYLQNWINDRIWVGDVPSDTFPDCFARQVDLHFSFGRGPVWCWDTHWWSNIVPAVAKAFGANEPLPCGGSIATVIVPLVIILFAAFWPLGRIIRLIWRGFRHAMKSPGA